MCFSGHRTQTREIVIWDNGLDGRDARVPRVARRSAYSSRSQREEHRDRTATRAAFRMTTSPYFVELDDDVVGRSRENGMRPCSMRSDDCRRRLLGGRPRGRPARPGLAVQTSHPAARVHPRGAQRRSAARRAGWRWLRHDLARAERARRRIPRRREAGLLAGGGGVHRGHPAPRVRAAVLADLRVHHTGGPHYGAISAEKSEFWAAYWKKQARRAAIKRLVFRVPFFRRLNAHFNWFVAPS